MKQRLLSGLLALCLLLSLLPPAAAIDMSSAPEGNWSEFASEGWADQYASSAEFTISSAEDLAAFALAVNEGKTFAGKTVKLAANIDLSAHEWTPIGDCRHYPNSPESSTQTHQFQGTFEGENFTISGLRISAYRDPYSELAGLFGYTVNAHIRNVRLADASVQLDLTTLPSEGFGGRMCTAGLLASWIVGTEIENVSVSGSLQVTVDEKFVFSGFGGVVGLADCIMTPDRLDVPVEQGSSLSSISVEGLELLYTGGSGTSFATPVGFGGILGAQGVLYTADISIGGAPIEEMELPTDIRNCRADGLTVTRVQSEGSCHEGVGGIIGVAHGQVSVADCTVQDFHAELAAEMPEYRSPDVIAGLYLGGIAGVFDGGSTMLRCTAQGEVCSDVTGAFSDSTGKSGGFYGGLAGMLGYPPEATSYDNWGTPAIRSTYKGLGATVKSCYADLTFEVQNQESVRHVSSLRAIKKDGSITVSHVISGVNTNVDYDSKWVCGWLHGGNGNKSTTYSYVHPVDTKLLYVGEGEEPFDYTYTPQYQTYDSMTDNGGGGYFHKIADWERSYTVASPDEILESGQGTSSLVFAKPGVYDVTVRLSRADDPDIALCFTLPVTVVERPVNLSGSLALSHQVGSAAWDQDDTGAHLLHSGAETLRFQGGFDLTEMQLSGSEDFDSAASFWRDLFADSSYGPEYDNYNYFKGSKLTLTATLDERFSPDQDWSKLSLDSNWLIVDPAGAVSYDPDSRELAIPVSMVQEKPDDPSPVVTLRGISGQLSDEAQAELSAGETLSLVTALRLEGAFVDPGYVYLRVLCEDRDTLLLKAATPLALRIADVTVYPGGENALSGFPEPTYLGLRDGADIRVNGESWEPQAHEGEPYPFTVEYRDAAGHTVENDRTPGVYTAQIVPLPGISLEQITVDGNPVVCHPGTLTVRHLSDPERGAECHKLLSSAPDSAVDEITVAVESDAVFYTNGNGSGLGTAERAGIALLSDELLLDQNREQLLIDHASGVTFTPGQYLFRYLDLVDTANGNAWVSADRELTVYWPYPAGTDAGDTFTLLHYTGLHREYALGGAPSLEEQIAASQVEQIPVEATPEGLRFTLSADAADGCFSPFALLWTEQGGGGVPLCALRYQSGGGTRYPTEYYPVNTVVTLDKVPVRKGYLFTGWYRDQALTHRVDTITMISDRTVYAGWQKEVADPDDTGVSDLLETGDHFAYLFGYPDGRFGPDNQMTRAEVAQMFYNLLREKGETPAGRFEDVPAESWYAPAVNMLASLGILNGVGENRFEPERPITRAEFTAIAMRFAAPESGGENIFSDVPADAWFYEPVVGSIRYGWIGGYPDGTFRPYNQITRAEVTTITNRMLARAADGSFLGEHAAELRQFPDVPADFWAYYDIMEATNTHDYTRTDGTEHWTGLRH